MKIYFLICMISLLANVIKEAPIQHSCKKLSKFGRRVFCRRAMLGVKLSPKNRRLYHLPKRISVEKRSTKVLRCKTQILSKMNPRHASCIFGIDFFLEKSELRLEHTSGLELAAMDTMDVSRLPFTMNGEGYTNSDLKIR